MSEPTPKPSAARWIVPLAVLFLFFAFCGGLALLLLGAMASGRLDSRETVLELAIRGEVSEAPDPVGSLLPGISAPPSIFEIRTALEQAAADEHVRGLRVEVEYAAIGWPAVEEVRAALDRFRRSGKPVHVYLMGDMVSDVDYALALGADKIWLAPYATLLVNGFQAEVTFWRGTLDKLHIEPNYFMLEEYKGFETMSNYQMSPPFRESLSDVLGDIFAESLARIAERRHLDLAAVQAATSRGMLSADEAIEAGFVDAVGSAWQVREELRQAAGTASYEGQSLHRYLAARSTAAALTAGEKVALVFGTGVIVATGQTGIFQQTFSGPDVAEAIHRAADDDSVKAILFRVDSPGGSPVGSEHVRLAIEYARQERRKPVVVSMSTYAASGGYWVSTAADAIVARPTTITGSIGVAFGKLDVSGLYELAGAHIDTVEIGENAGILSMVQSLDPLQRERILGWMQHLYAEFKRHVAAGRGLEPALVDGLAKGRIWSGTDALASRLVDRLGGYDEALAVLREKLGLAADAEMSLVIYPRPKSLLDWLFSDEVTLESRSLRALTDPTVALERALGELGRPGACLLSPEVRLR